ncbi:MAG: diadenylate cyclase CdaA [Deltaproteobacteria bacterium]
MVIVDTLKNFGWLDFLDVLLVAILTYQIILLLKGNRMVRLLAALCLLLVVQIITQVSGLTTLNQIMENFLGSLLLVIVVLYQHEIRRLLFTFSRQRHVREQPPYVPQLIEEIVTAAIALKQKNIGALIVIEREEEVNSFLEVGTEIDAKVICELITSIFLPYSPIHDGAIIIQKGKLTRAGCFLPLSRTPGISKTFGTRHRAAIGITERTDAVVVVVSEETGKISIAVEGRITQDLDQNGLRKLLKKLLEPRQYRWLR